MDLEPAGDGEFETTVQYGEAKLIFFLKTRGSAGNSTVLYDSARRCYIYIVKTQTEFDDTNYKKKKAVPMVILCVYVIYHISDTKCRYVICNHGFMGMKDASDTVQKMLNKKRGKQLYEQWSNLARDRREKYGNERPKVCPELDTLDAYMKKYLPNDDSVKTFAT